MKVPGPAERRSPRAVVRDLAKMSARGPVVLKLGGRALEAPEATTELVADVAAARVPLVVVHGGGAEVSGWCRRLGIEPRFEGGRRVTDRATLEVAVAVLAGLANKRLVAGLRAAGLDAVGLAGLDGGLAEVAPHEHSAVLGEVGSVARVHPALIETLLAQGRVPVLASIAADGPRLLNVNADDFAAAIAGALSAPELILLSDTPGLFVNGARVPRLAEDELDGILAHPDVRDGMRPKLAAARAALEAGVERVHIAAWEGPGTLRAILAASAAESVPGTWTTFFAAAVAGRIDG